MTRATRWLGTVGGGVGVAVFASFALVACSSSNGAPSAGGDASACEGASSCGADSGAADDTGTIFPGEDATTGDDGGGGGPPLESEASLSDRGQAPCQVTLSGAQSHAFSCFVGASYTTANMLTTFTLTVPMPQPLEQVTVTLQHVGTPQTGTWASTDTGANGSVSVLGLPGAMVPEWAAVGGGSSATGSYSADLTFALGKPTAMGEMLGTNGTLTATLTPVTQTGATGTVKFSATF
jgi:hypothetical protein